jgi:dCTP deaminase
MLDEISRLKELRFPYRHGWVALERIKGHFDVIRRELSSGIAPGDHAGSIHWLVQQPRYWVAYYLPFLGMIERSTSPRTPFEVHGPLLRLARQLVGVDESQSESSVSLVLSSEWDDAPLLYADPRGLRGFVFLGLPAYEADNPLLVPMAGHELGHLAWRRIAADAEWGDLVKEAVSAALSEGWGAFQSQCNHSQYPDHEWWLDPRGEAEQTYIDFIDQPAEWALSQCQETFADFVGLLLFGRSYVRAFAYLLTPGLESPDPGSYPPDADRARSLRDMAASAAWRWPAELEDYGALFPAQEAAEPEHREAFQLWAADRARTLLLDKLWSRATEVVQRSGVPEADDRGCGQVRARFEKGVPVGSPATLSDILNAAWDAMPTLAAGLDDATTPTSLGARAHQLGEVVLKSCEILEYEARTGRTAGALVGARRSRCIRMKAMLKADRIADRLARDTVARRRDPLVITPLPARSFRDLGSTGSASVDLRLGTWFVVLRRDRLAVLRAGWPSPESHLATTTYVPFGGTYCLHPGTFVLGITLEWIRLPYDLAAYVIGRSSWGRRGLIIATATAVHPGFAGCLTLELSNIGETPVELKPGTTVCQLCLHPVETREMQTGDVSTYAGRRKPIIGSIQLDEVALALSRPARDGGVEATAYEALGAVTLAELHDRLSGFDLEFEWPPSPELPAEMLQPGTGSAPCLHAHGTHPDGGECDVVLVRVADDMFHAYMRREG